MQRALTCRSINAGKAHTSVMSGGALTCAIHLGVDGRAAQHAQMSAVLCRRQSLSQCLQTQILDIQRIA
jgi:hypothetical protein